MTRIKIGNKFADIDVLEIAKEYGLKGSVMGDEYVCVCPFHNDTSPSFSIKISGEKAGLYQCFSPNCAKTGNIVTFIMTMEGCGYREALASLIVAEAPLKVEDVNFDYILKKLTSLCEETHRVKLRFPNPPDCEKRNIELFFTSPHELGGRGYSKEDFRKLNTENIVYCVSGFYSNRIIIPIYNDDGEQVAFVARTIDKEVAEKYRYPKGWLKHNFICRLIGDESKSPIICEGYFDGLHVQGIWGRTALITFGSSITATQVNYISKHYSKAIFAYDADTAGRKGVVKSSQIAMQYGLDVSILQLPDKCDPATVSQKVFQELQEIKAVDFINEYNTKSILEKLKI